MRKLAICVATYNRWESLSKTLNSLLSEAKNSESIIVVDDHSDLSPPGYMKKLLAKSSIYYCRHEENKGLAAARNTAIALADTEYFAFCDDDDQWPPSLSKKLVLAMDSGPADIGMAIGLSEDQRNVCGHLFESFPRLTDVMKAGLTPPVGSQIYRTELLRQVGGYRSEVSSGVDHDLWISLARIDPRVAVAWGEPAIVGNSALRQRMTTVEHRRRAGIEKSLAIWRDDLCEVFGESFYHHFVHCYRRYLDYSFFIKSVRKREYVDTALRATRTPWLPIELIRQIWDRIRGRSRCNLFPAFKGE